MKFLLPALLIAAIFTSCAIEENNQEILDQSPNKQLTVCISPEEMELYNLINEYRVNNGLEEIELSASLTFVAQEHSRDQAINNPCTDGCNLHSWSGNGDWSACCYKGGEQASCMWNKPKELTSYGSNGYEISYYTSGDLNVKDALQKWQESSGHNALLINENTWEHVKWNAIGIGVYDGYANVWFGEVVDKAGAPGSCMTSK